MIDLGCAVGSGKRDVVDPVVDICVQTDLGDELDKQFADEPFSPWGFDDPDNDGKREYPPKLPKNNTKEWKIDPLSSCI